MVLWLQLCSGRPAWLSCDQKFGQSTARMASLCPVWKAGNYLKIPVCTCLTFSLVQLELLPECPDTASPQGVGFSLHSSWALQGSILGAREGSKKTRQNRMTFSELALEDTQHHFSIRYRWKQSDAYPDHGEGAKDPTSRRQGCRSIWGLCLKILQ
ncbi:unnamed protein product [Rangifer tarandus platyrhynchus]|uniref:Uncharacterized protein n=1 Tax=Rangifer tarandus platyrhynchus TaxID=3082113 RepID=A0ABN8Z0V0_RANTA|nr:unnamed protein product [Rangifer tarandus platyrhynchus]